MAEKVWVIFDGPPEHEAGRFVEVENVSSYSVNAGKWEERRNGFWRLGPYVCAVAHEDEITRLTAERDALREALKHYGEHICSCSFGYANKIACDCGLDAALAAGGDR